MIFRVLKLKLEYEDQTTSYVKQLTIDPDIFENHCEFKLDCSTDIIFIPSTKSVQALKADAFLLMLPGMD